MVAETVVVGILLGIIALIDLKYQQIPSILLTGLLFVVAVLNPTGLFFGVLGLIIGLLLLEAGFIEGIADLKVIALISLMVGSLWWFMVLVILTLVYGMVWKIAIKYTHKNIDKFAFLPVMVAVYVSLAITGGLG